MTDQPTNDALPAHLRQVALTGRLGVQTNVDLADRLAQEIDASAGAVLLDMSAVEFVSSSGLRALMMAYKHAAARGKKMAMINTRPNVYKTFKLTAADTLFHVFENRDDALAMLAP